MLEVLCSPTSTLQRCWLCSKMLSLTGCTVCVRGRLFSSFQNGNKGSDYWGKNKWLRSYITTKKTVWHIELRNVRFHWTCWATQPIKQTQRPQRFLWGSAAVTEYTSSCQGAHVYTRSYLPLLFFSSFSVSLYCVCFKKKKKIFFFFCLCFFVCVFFTPVCTSCLFCLF